VYSNQRREVIACSSSSITEGQLLKAALFFKLRFPFLLQIRLASMI
jgi:hypothetical protein